jgi:hypothetical protein
MANVDGDELCDTTWLGCPSGWLSHVVFFWLSAMEPKTHFVAAASLDGLDVPRSATPKSHSRLPRAEKLLILVILAGWLTGRVDGQLL